MNWKNNLCSFATLRFCVKTKVIFLLLFALAISSVFAQEQYLIKDKELNEISGIAASRTCPWLFYVHNDSGGKNEIYVINQQGKTITSIVLTGTTNRDWEDIAVGPGQVTNQSYIYVGEIGDNKAKYPSLYLYCFPEPKINSIKQKVATITVPTDSITKYNFSFDDGAKDCETLMIDPANGDVYLVSKREEKVGLYQIKAPLRTSVMNIAKRLVTLDFPLAVAGDITAKGDKIIIKTYSSIYCWNIKPNQSIANALTEQPNILPYQVEPQGEAVCFSPDGKQYYTISEKDGNNPLYLYSYPLASDTNK